MKIFSFLCVCQLVLVLAADLVQVDGQLGHGSCNVLGPDFNLAKVLPVIQVGSTNLLSNLFTMHVAVAKQGHHVEALGWRQMDPLHRRIQSRGAVDVLDGVPFHTPFLERRNPVVVVAGMFLDVVVVHICRKQQNKIGTGC